MNTLVVGAQGLLGRTLVKRGIKGLNHRECDVTDQKQMIKALKGIDLVYFCAAITDVDYCEEFPDISYKVNVNAPAMWAKEVPIVFLSSNYVFSGTGPHYPNDLKKPIQQYGIQKALAEDLVLASGGSVIRTGWLYGKGGTSFPSVLADMLRKGNVRALTDQIVQPTWAEDLAETVLKTGSGKIIHAIGSEECTWFEFAYEVANHKNFKNKILPIKNLNFKAKRPKDARLAPSTLPGWKSRISEIVKF